MRELDDYSVDELSDLIEYASDLLMTKKQPKRAMHKNTFLQDMKMCYSKLWFKSKRYAEKAAAKYSKKFNVKYRVYICPNCGSYHLTTRLEEQ